MIEFAYIWALAGLVLLPIVWVLARRIARGRRAAMRFSDSRHLKSAPVSLALRMRPLLLVARLLALVLLIGAMARPQHGISERNLFVEGIDIMIALDVSGSMQAEDFAPNRLEAAKAVLNQFVAGRESDRIGVVVFATSAFTLTPLTLDYRVIEQFVDRVTFGIVDPNQTAVGSALATAVKKMEDSDAKSKVVILLTDGESNAGRISPELAAETAKALGVRVYTIGVGSDRQPVRSALGAFFGGGATRPASFDEETLQKIADETGGEYFRARDERGLEQIFAEIDELETTERTETTHVNYSDRMAWLVWPALLLLLGEVALRHTRFATAP